eukprot:COSAG06_NODE_1212_length_10244_cov_2.817447_11_plen_1060_part_00
MFSASAASGRQILRIQHRGSAATTAVQPYRPSRERGAAHGHALKPVGEPMRCRFASAPGEWLCLGGETLYDSREMDWSPFLLFVSAAAAAGDGGEDDERQIAVARLGPDGSWCGFEVVQDLPSLAATGGGVHVWLGDGPVVCVHDLGGAAGSGRLLVLCPAPPSRDRGAPWQSCMVSVAPEEEDAPPPAAAAAPDDGHGGATAAGTQSCALLYCGPLPIAPHAAELGAPPCVLFAERSRAGETSLRWLAVEHGGGSGGSGSGSAALVSAPRPPMRLAHSYCTAPPCSICWVLPHADPGLLDEPITDAAGALFVGLDNGRLLKLDALDALSAMDASASTATLRLLNSRDLRAAGPEPVMHLRIAAFGSEGGRSDAVEVVVAQQRSVVHLLSTASLTVLKRIELAAQTPSATSSPAETAMRHAVLVDRFSEGCAGGVDELLLLDLTAGIEAGSDGGRSASARRLGGQASQAEWRVSTAASFALHGGSFAPDAGSEPRLVARHGLYWQHEYAADAVSSQDSTSSAGLTQGSTQRESFGGDSGSGSTQAQAIDSFTSSLQHRLQAAQQALHQKQRMLVDKRSLLRYTQKLLVETAAVAAAGTDAHGRARSTLAVPAEVSAENDRMARSGLRSLLPTASGESGADADDPAEASMRASGFVPPGFAGMVVPRSSAAHGDVSVVTVSQHTVAAGTGGGGGGSGMDLCLQVGVCNSSAQPVHDVSITILPWRSGSVQAVRGAVPAALPPPLPSVTSALQTLPGGGLGETIQAVVGVSALLGLGGGDQSGQGGGGGSERIAIGAPRRKGQTPTTVSLYLQVTWQQGRLGAEAEGGGRTARGIVHGPVTLDLAQLLQPRHTSSSVGGREAKRQRSHGSAPTTGSAAAAAVAAARHVSLEHVPVLLLREHEDDDGSGGGGEAAAAAMIDIHQLAAELAAQSGLQQQQVITAAQPTANDNGGEGGCGGGAGLGGVLLRPPTAVEVAAGAQVGGGGLSGVSSAFLSAHSGPSSSQGGPIAGGAIGEADRCVSMDTDDNGGGDNVDDAIVRGAGAANRARMSRYSRLVSCQLW